MPGPPRLRRVRLTLSAALLTVGGVLTIGVSPSVAAEDAPTTAELAVSAETPKNGTVAVSRTADPRAVVLHRRAAEAVEAYKRANERVTRLSGHATRLRDQTDRAAEAAARAHAEVANSPVGSAASAVSDILGGDESAADRAELAVDAHEHAEQLAVHAEQALSEAETELKDARRAAHRAQAKLAQVEVEVAARMAAETAAEQAEFRRGYRVDDPAQDRRNRKALKRWQSYLDSLADARVVPPAATALENPKRLPEGLQPAYDDQARPVAGVAVVDDGGAVPAVVLPAATIRAVSAAFSRVGLPNAAGDVSFDDYACGGLTSEVWSAAATPIPAGSAEQWVNLAGVRDGQLQVGDLVYLGDERVGVHQAGVHLGEGLMIAADPADGQVAVKPVPTKAMYGAKRVTLPAEGSTQVPTPEGVTIGCGKVAKASTSMSTSTASYGWSHPLPEGVYSDSASFGVAGALWSTGQHTGQDYAAALGTPVHASREGVVSVERPGWAGNLVRIDHGGGVETWYAHLSRVVVQDGQRVSAGDVVGAVGSEGNSTGPHLHFELRLDGEPIDPGTVLGSEAPAAMLGPYQNGEIPSTALCAATTDGHLLRCDAAVAYRLMDAAFAAEYGTALCITDSYRSRESQERLFVVKPQLAAVPGTSTHGLGMAVDLCGGVEQFGTAEHDWVVNEGPSFGWIHPGWAQQGGSRPEAWHYEFTVG